MSRLRAMGVRLAIDDFGTGYSSLSYLTRFPVDFLKIDRSFVAALAAGDADPTLVQTIVEMSRSLGLETIAEGIERSEQMDVLRDPGHDHGPGLPAWPDRCPIERLTWYLRGRQQPVSAAAIVAAPSAIVPPALPAIVAAPRRSCPRPSRRSWRPPRPDVVRGRGHAAAQRPAAPRGPRLPAAHAAAQRPAAAMRHRSDQTTGRRTSRGPPRLSGRPAPSFGISHAAIRRRKAPNQAGAALACSVLRRLVSGVTHPPDDPPGRRRRPGRPAPDNPNDTSPTSPDDTPHAPDARAIREAGRHPW